MKKFIPFASLLMGAILTAQSESQAAPPEAVIIATGSTNTPGLTISMPVKGKALLERARGGAKSHISVNAQLKARLMKDLAAATPVDQLITRHCAKSASFGSRIFVQYQGVRSPDISCPGQTDPKVQALQTDVNAIMAEVNRK